MTNARKDAEAIRRENMTIFEQPARSIMRRLGITDADVARQLRLTVDEVAAVLDGRRRPSATFRHELAILLTEPMTSLFRSDEWAA